VASYAYDYRGRRISRTIYGAPNVTIRYAYDGDRIIAEYDGSGTLLRKFVYGPGLDEPICLIDAGNGNAAYYYHLDGLGSVVALSNVNKVLVERYAYDVFGRPTIRDPNGVVLAESARGNPYLFTGRAYDGESGLYYYRARYYDYATGRFLQADPIRYGDGLNLYAYVANNPTGSVDPMGLSGMWQAYRGEFYANLPKPTKNSDWGAGSAFVRFLTGGGATQTFPRDHPFSIWAANQPDGITPEHTVLTQVTIADLAAKAYESGLTEFSAQGTWPPETNVYSYSSFKGAGTLSEGWQNRFSDASWSAEVKIQVDSSGKVIASGTVTYDIWDRYTWERKLFPLLQYFGDAYWQHVIFDKPFSVEARRSKGQRGRQ
jgi:RHS repeat-associated protein